MTPSALEFAPGAVRIAMIVLTLLNAVGAAGGAVMLIGWGLGDVTETRLGPLGFTSWAPGGAFLALGVALPMALAGLLLLANHPWGPLVTLLAGLALMSWIVAQVTLIGFASWLQPLYFVVGAAVAGGGMLLIRAA